MPIDIRVVQRADDVEKVRTLWREVLPEAGPGDGEGSGLAPGDTAVLISDGNRPIGALRMTRGCARGRTTLSRPDLEALAPFLAGGRRVAVADRVVLDERYLARFSIVFATVKVALQVVRSWSCDHFVFVAPSSLVRDIQHVGLTCPAGARAEDSGAVALHAPVSALRQPFLAELGSPMAGLGPFFHRIVYVQGDVVFGEGDPGDRAYVVARGSVSVTATRPVGEGGTEEVLIDLLGPGELVGELALLDGAPRMATVRAYAGETDLWVIEASRFHRALEEDPALVKPVLQLLASRLRKSTRRAIALAPDDAGPDLLRLFLDVARSCGLRRSGMIPGLTPEWVAGQLGRLPDAVLEMSGVLERRGLITWAVEGLWIHDLEALATAWSGKPAARRTSGKQPSTVRGMTPPWNMGPEKAGD